MRQLILILLLAISVSITAQEQYRDTIYVSTDKTTIIHITGNIGFVNSIEIPKSTLDPKNIKGKLIYYKVDDIDYEGSRIYRLKAIRPFNENIFGTVISDGGLSFTVKYSDTSKKSYYKIDFKKPILKQENIKKEEEEEVFTPKKIKYSTKQIVSFEAAKENVFDCIKVNNSVFFSVKKAFRDEDLIFIKIKIANKSLKDFTPDDLAIQIKDNIELINFEFKQFFLETIKALTSIEGVIIIRDERVLDDNILNISLKELTNNRDLVLELPIKKVERLQLLKSKK
jgi:hypothetical protein